MSICRLIVLSIVSLVLSVSSTLATEKVDGQHPAAMEMKEHLHPALEPAVDVGLDEQLGAHIPLDLTFLDEHGQTVTLRALIDRPTLIAPVYYKCPNVCNFMQGGLAEMLPEVNLGAGTDYRVLSISFDETETPALAARSKEMYLHAAQGKIPPEAWRFLTGSRENILHLFDSVGFHFQRKGVDFLHPVVAFVVSPEGVVTRYLHGTRFLPKDVTLALIEASEGRVGTTIQKMLRYCFSYDAEGKTYVFNLLRVTGAVVLLVAGGFLLFLLLGGRKKKS